MQDTFSRGKKGRPRSRLEATVARLMTWQDKTLRNYIVEHNLPIRRDVARIELISAVALHMLTVEKQTANN